MYPPLESPRERAELPYIPAPLLADEDARQRALECYEILETEAEQSYDDLTMLASTICGTPIALLSLIESERQWFKSRVGLGAQSTPRAWSFCAHAILQPQNLLEVPDALEDVRFAGNPLVQGGVKIRFYAGAPLVNPDGVPFGTICVIDRIPRRLTTEQHSALQALARQTVAQLELRLAVRELERQSAQDALLRSEKQLAFDALELRNEELAESRAVALRANQAKSEFLSRMSHEMRTPLNGVLGMNQLLLDTSPSPDQRRYIDVAQSSGRTLLALIDDLLDLAKIEAGKVAIESVDFDLRDVITEILEMWGIQATAKGLAFSSGITPEFPRLVRGDPHRLRQILNNLAANAIKFTAQGEIGIYVELTGKQEERITVRFAVHDTGIGIRPDQVTSLFSPFEQADVSTTRNYGGTGLGLAICKHLVELMGGTIGIESQEGRGSVFWFVLRFEVAQGMAPLSVDSTAASRLSPDLQQATPAIENRRPWRILVADDNQINRLVLLAQLKKYGYQAEAVVNGAEAVQAATVASYDLVLMDCEMPVMDGYEATDRIRQVHSGDVRIVAVTAHAMSGERERCIAAGMDDFLSKPIDTRALAHLLAKWCPVVQ